MLDDLGDENLVTNDLNAFEPSRDIFEMLSLAPKEANKLATKASSVYLNSRPVSFAVDYQNQWLVLVPLEPGSPELSITDLVGLVVRTHNQGPDKVATIRSLDQNTRGQFSYFVDDLITHLGAKSSSAHETVVQTIEMWRAIFSAKSSTFLSESKQIGLLAELILLKELIDIAPSAALSMWLGPEPGRHDFGAEKCAIEVKATLTRETFPIAVHGLHQLAAPKAGALYILGFQFERHNNGINLINLIKEIQKAGIDKVRFNSLLAREGFDTRHEAVYKEHSFKIFRSKIVAVDASTPRIVKENLKDPTLADLITKVQYSIDLGPLKPASPDNLAVRFAAERLI